MLLFNAPATTEIYTLSLHDALPISGKEAQEIFAAEQGETPTLKEVAESDIYLDIGDKDPQNFESIIEATENAVAPERSEERRVGKDGRDREGWEGRRDHNKRVNAVRGSG